MTRVIVTALVSAVLTGAIGWFLLPVLRALKAGQSIREIGPSWHNTKAGTPTMGGIGFILAILVAVAIFFVYVGIKGNAFRYIMNGYRQRHRCCNLHIIKCCCHRGNAFREVVNGDGQSKKEG